jgi:four helix bundle protein
MILSWDKFAKWTVGKQLAEAVDSVGANIAEAQGRRHPKDVINFLLYARGSLQETRYWLRRASQRELVKTEDAQKFEEILKALTPQLNAFITANRKKQNNNDGKHAG